MHTIEIFDVGDEVWFGDYNTSSKTETVMGPLKVVQVLGTSSSYCDLNKLFCYRLSNQINYYNGNIHSSREEAVKFISNTRKKAEKKDTK